MTLPINLTFVRTGESEASAMSGEFAQQDWHLRLNAAGRRQAAFAAEKFNGRLADRFDMGFVSPSLRARETASVLGESDFAWLVDTRLTSRDATARYGEQHISSSKELVRRVDVTERRSTLYSVSDRETVSSEVFDRVHDFLGTLHREYSDSSVVVVTSSQFIWAARAVLERLLPEELDERMLDDRQTLRPCTIMTYTRRHPGSGEVQGRFGWRKITYIRPDTEQSPFYGEWQALVGRRYLTSAELAETVHRVRPVRELDSAV